MFWDREEPAGGVNRSSMNLHGMALRRRDSPMGRHRIILLGSIVLLAGLAGCAGTRQGLLNRAPAGEGDAPPSRWALWHSRSTATPPGVGSPTADNVAEGTASGPSTAQPSSAAKAEENSPFPSPAKSGQVSARVAQFFPLFQRGDGSPMPAGRPSATDMWAKSAAARSRGQDEGVTAREPARTQQREDTGRESVLPVALQIKPGAAEGRPRVEAIPRVSPGLGGNENPAPATTAVAVTPEASPPADRQRSGPSTTPEWAVPAASAAPVEPDVVPTAASIDEGVHTPVPVPSGGTFPIELTSASADLGPGPAEPQPPKPPASTPVPSPDTPAPVPPTTPAPELSPPTPLAPAPEPIPPAPKPKPAPVPPAPKPNPAPAPPAPKPVQTPAPTAPVVPPTPPAPPAPVLNPPPAPAPLAPAPKPSSAPAPGAVDIMPEPMQPEPVATPPTSSLPMAPVMPEETGSGSPQAEAAPVAVAPVAPSKAQPAVVAPAKVAPGPSAQVTPQAAVPAAKKSHRFGLGLFSRWSKSNHAADPAPAETPAADTTLAATTEPHEPVTAPTRMLWPFGRFAAPKATTAAVSGAPSQATAPAVSVVPPEGKTVAAATGVGGSRSDLPGAIDLVNRTSGSGATAPAASSSATATPASPSSAPLPAGAPASAASDSGTPTPGPASGTPPARPGTGVTGASVDPSAHRGKPDVEARADSPRPASSLARRDAVYPAVGAESSWPGSFFPTTYYDIVTTPTAAPRAPLNPPPPPAAHDSQVPGDASSADAPPRLTLWSRFMNRLHRGGDASN